MALTDKQRHRILDFCFKRVASRVSNQPIKLHERSRWKAREKSREAGHDCSQLVSYWLKIQQFQSDWL